MKRPTVASLKKVTAENLANLGAERLAEILVSVAAARPELKRRLRMELAAEQGAEHLALEIDKRLGSLATSRSKVSWRQRPAFVRDLEALRVLIADRMATLDPPGALERMWRFLALARPIGRRVRDRDGEAAAVFARSASDLGGMLARHDPEPAGEALATALMQDPALWSEWLDPVVAVLPPQAASAALRRLSSAEGASSTWLPLLRRLADAAGDAHAYRATFTDAALRTPSAAAEVARRLLAAGDVEQAGEVLQAAVGKPGRGLIGKARPAEPDFDWEGVWIDYLERCGRTADAQAARWVSFERTLSAARAREFTTRLPDFEDVEAEQRAFAYAAAHSDFERGLAFLMAWPALPEAARMIETRGEEAAVAAEAAELWATRLRARHPKAARLLLRKAAAAALRRRDFAACERLTEEAEALGA
jgi:hypothetical protein